MSKTFVSTERTVRAVDDVSLSMQAGEVVALVGGSGSGKTTLLRMLACQLAPDSGEIAFDGEPLPAPHTTRGAQFRNHRVGFVFQEFGLIEQETARVNVALPLRYAGVRRSRALAAADGLLHQMKVPHLATSRVRNLSAGQRQRVAIARAYANNPPVILADEPTSNLDTDNRDTVIASLLSLRGSDTLVVIATHDEVVWGLCDRVVRLENGRVRP